MKRRTLSAIHYYSSLSKNGRPLFIFKLCKKSVGYITYLINLCSAKDLVAKIEENFKTAEVSTWKQGSFSIWSYRLVKII